MSSYQKEYNGLPNHLKTAEFMSYLQEDSDFSKHADSDGEILEDVFDVGYRYRKTIDDNINTSPDGGVKQTTTSFLLKDIDGLQGKTIPDLVCNFNKEISSLASQFDSSEGDIISYNFRQEQQGEGFWDEIFLDITSERLETEEETQERLWEVEENNKIINFQKFLDKKIKQYPVYLKRKEIEKLTKEIKDLTKRIKND